LFFGFVIFAGSDFGRTVALGLLTSTTLLCAMFTNLIVLPALLIDFDHAKVKRGEQGLIDEFNDFYLEDDDEEIDIRLLEVKHKQVYRINSAKATQIALLDESSVCADVHLPSWAGQPHI
jgi:predicted RND superfamily exporter protein